MANQSLPETDEWRDVKIETYGELFDIISQGHGSESRHLAFKVAEAAEEKRNNGRR